MSGMSESCSVCGGAFEVQFRYQMEEKDGGFLFFCSQACQSKSVRGEHTGGVTCSACAKRFVVELVSQVVRVRGERVYACSESCRVQVLAEAGGAPLSAFVTPEQMQAPVPPPAPSQTRLPSTKTPSALTPQRPFAGPRRLAIFNHKGGTGKTTTSVSVAAGLASRGFRVLLVDTDSQGNVGVSLGVKSERSLYHVLVMGLRPADAAVTIRPNLDVIVSNETLAAAELYLAGRQNRDRVLRERLLSVVDSYDVVVLDCSPSLSLMNQNALVFADGILVPVACDFLSLVGVRQVIKTVKNVNTLLHHPVHIFGVLPTFYDGRARLCRDAVETLKSHFAEKCLPPIRSTIRIKEAPAQGRTIYEYAPDSHACEDYQRLVELIIGGPAALRERVSVDDERGGQVDAQLSAALA